MNGKGTTVWAGNVLVMFDSKDAKKLAEAVAVGHEAAPFFATLSISPS